MSERELLWECVAFLERTSHETESDRLRLADKLRAAIADRPEQPVAWRWIPNEHHRYTYSEQKPLFTFGVEPLYAAPVARPEPAQPLRQFGDVRYAAAVDLVLNKTGTLSELWVVWGPPEKDGKRYPEYCAGWPEACHEHINDALDNELDEAKDWVVRQAFLTPQEPAQPVAQLADDLELESNNHVGRSCRGDVGLRHASVQLLMVAAAEILRHAAPPSHPAPSETLVPACIKETGCEHPVACNATQRCALARLAAPSEAGAERQEYWCPFKDSACGDDPAKRCADCAQPAKGDAS